MGFRSSATSAGKRVLLASLAVSLLAGCGKSGSPSGSGKTQRATQGPGVPSSAVAVIGGWADALRTGHPGKAAGYWALPSVLVNGTDTSGRLVAIEIRSTADALAADESLPCGATLKATVLDGRYIRARFVLGSRKGVARSVSCGGLADVDFQIASGHIERWVRVGTGAPAAPGSRAASLRTVLRARETQI